MKFNKINISIGVLLVGTTIFIIKKVKQKNLSNKVDELIKSAENITGTGYDLGNASYMSGQYIKDLQEKYGIDKIQTLPKDVLIAKAKALRSYLTSFDIPEDKVLALFKTLPTKANISAFVILYKYATKYDLWNDLKAMDYNFLQNAYRNVSPIVGGITFGLFGGRTSTDDLPELKKYLDSLPSVTLADGTTIK